MAEAVSLLSLCGLGVHLRTGFDAGSGFHEHHLIEGLAIEGSYEYACGPALMRVRVFIEHILSDRLTIQGRL